MNYFLKAHKRFFIKDNLRNLNILDVGCGDGNKTLPLIEEGCKIDFVDLDQISLSLIKKNNNINIYNVDAIKFLENIDKKYDVIFCIDVIEHIEKEYQLRFLDLLISRLKFKGILLLQTINNNSPFANIYFYGDITHTRILPFELVENFVKKNYLYSKTFIRNTPCLTFKSLISRWLISFPIILVTNYLPKLGLGIRTRVDIFSTNYLYIFKKFD